MAPILFVTSEHRFKYPSRFVVSMLLLIGYAISKTFWFIRYSGVANIPPASAGGFIIAANHQTYIDPVWIAIPMRRRFRFMAYDKLFERRNFGGFIRYLGAFPVAFDGVGAIRAMREALYSLRGGGVLTVFPEGAREFAEGNLLEFKEGVVLIAERAKVPIVPVTIRGGNRIWPRGQKYPRLFRRVEVIYHAPIILESDSHADAEAQHQIWTDLLRTTITDGLERD